MDSMSTTHRKIMKVVKEKNLEQLNDELGGIEGVATALGTHTRTGIPDDEKKIDQQRKKFGSNTYKMPRPKGFFRTLWRPLQEFAILIDFVNMLAAFILFVAAYGTGSCMPSSAHKSRANISEDEIKVLRGGQSNNVSKSEIVVGDVVCLKFGDEVPADGLFLRGNNLQLEERDSEISGRAVQVVNAENPFLFSGSQVVNPDGGGQMMVTSVGMKAKWCEMMGQHSCGSSDEEIVKVEDQVYVLTCSIRKKVGLPIALLGVIALLPRYFTGNTKSYEGNQEFVDGDIRVNFWDSSLLKFIGAAFTTVFTVIPESLRLGVALTTFYSKKRMMADMEMVSDTSVSCCETMGSVTTICTSKTGILTMNQMEVKKFYLGEHCVLESEAYSTNAPTHVKNLLKEGIALNTSPSTPTDKAILLWAVRVLDIDMEVESRCTVLRRDHRDDEAPLNLNSQKKKRSGVLMKREVDNTVHVHWKGEAEAILKMCSSCYDISISGNLIDLDDGRKVTFRRIVQHMTERSLQCIAFAHNQVELVDGPDPLKENGLVLLGLVGIKDPCRPKMKEAVKDCQNAGVDVKMFTSDNISSAKHIARECGILLDIDDQEGAVITGEAFRRYSENERMEKVDQIRVMANSSQDDKLLMVKTLKKKDAIVAVSGNSTKDVLALLEADVGISMGIKSGTDVAKKVSDIVILDDGFASVARVLKSSICIYNNMQKFIQFELTLNLAALAIIFISAACAGEILLTSGDVLWLNLIVNTLASLALAMERPTEEPIKRQPVGRKEPLISNIMLRNLLAQVLYQIVVVFTLMFKAKSILGVETMTANSIRKRNTLIFHAFLLCQVFNEFNARNLEKKNVFKGLLRDRLFLVFIAITISVEVMFVELFVNQNDYFERLELWQWGICFGIGFVSWPIGCVVKCIPVPEKPVRCYLGLVN
ncbi:calcium-transporting ATPase 12, plasma membrane-type-like [Ziziphus jujuba]|uniref:Calcium-transporting ATPase n=1 Tax=Ziziphus jujuba TaxID=326968 RepID=A0ABM4A3Z0_ZIZJJ|nr:calcium-transporting ATPase 12, plasma membrane-type-like [Ziziphus jujuba]